MEVNGPKRWKLASSNLSNAPMSYLQAPCGQRTTPNPCLRLTFDRVKSLKIHHAKTVLVILVFFNWELPANLTRDF